MKFEPGGFARGTRSPLTRVHTYVTPWNLDLKTGTYPERQIRRGIF